MFYDEEQLPLYIPKNQSQYKNSSSINLQNIITSQNQINGTKNKKSFSKKIDIHDKIKSNNKENKLVKYIYSFMNILFNNKNTKITLFFFILICTSYIEYFIDKFIDIFALKFLFLFYF